MVKKKKKKKRKVVKRKKSKDPLFYVARTSSVQVQDGDSIDVKIICPSCQSHWGVAKVVFGGHITPESITVLEPFKASCKIEAGKPLTCPACMFRYTSWAVMALIVSAMRRKELDESIGSGFHPLSKV